ncbi:MAG: class I SAM-dependent methyltransferase [Ignavibacteriales bacterium]|nr:class I SAM-dependent methyltransferase [Ignavibacteriales bacterium]
MSAGAIIFKELIFYHALKCKKTILPLISKTKTGCQKNLYLPSDLLRYLSFNRKTLQPPKGMIFTGSGDFVKQGETFLRYFIEYGNLKPDDSVLDIGSGIGRMAIPLTSYLSEKGKYEGFDIVKKGVDWCKKEITARFPRFNFTHIELRNTLYNTDTEKIASDFKFPYSDEYFDFVFLISVFTHMLPADVENYLREINRVLKPKGICFATLYY